MRGGARATTSDKRTLALIHYRIVFWWAAAPVATPKHSNQHKRMRQFGGYAMAPSACTVVANLARPGGNITGLSNQTGELAAKRVGLLREVVPRLSRLAILANTCKANTGKPTRFLKRTEPVGKLLWRSVGHDAPLGHGKS